MDEWTGRWRVDRRERKTEGQMDEWMDGRKLRMDE